MRGGTGDGISVLSAAPNYKDLVIEHGTVAGWSQIRIHVQGSGDVIEGNSVISSHSYGILVDTAGNIIVRNTAKDNGGGNYNIAGGNDVGPIGSAAAATSPWANIAF